MIDRTHYDAVLKDLRENYDTLKGNLEEMETAIRVLERLYAKPAKPLKLVVDAPKRQPHTLPVNGKTVPFDPPPSHPAVKDEFSLESAREHDVVAPFTVGLETAVSQAASEYRYDHMKLVHRVMEVRPGTTYPSAASAVSRMLTKGLIHKGDDLIIRPVVNGKIQGLPPANQDDINSHRRIGQYETQ
jgi:hypothetical protein